ncbi:MAG: transcriptional repressor [Lentisphaeria bacterium]|nr:transcriptional repressor [Lentisphaeria bacterium]
MKELSESELIALLRSCGISPSPQRIAIYGYLKSHPVHPTADVIMKELKPHLPTLSLTTVYNTLKLFVSKKLVSEVIIEDGELRFDADLKDHAHFKCTRCQQVFDLFPEGNRMDISGLPALPEGFSAESVHICFRGKCSSCRE